MENSITVLCVNDLDQIAPLWEKLNSQHYAKSAHFKDHFSRQTFETRSTKWRSLPENSVHIGMARDKNGAVVGYCVCSAQGETGELDSIYTEPEYRGREIGSKLAADGIAWLKEKGCRNIDVLVAEGNEAVFPFYEKLGFRVRGTVLRI